jgi:GrpB-like predicted nucleotidyltransferase (UPF0157 family)
MRPAEATSIVEPMNWGVYRCDLRCRILANFVSSGGLHVWPRDTPEPVRHRLFRDWLRSHPEDRELYATAKRRLARETAQQPGGYGLAKNDVIDDIYARIFAAASGDGRG